MEDLQKQYSSHLEARGLSQTTLYNYTSDLKKFELWYSVEKGQNLDPDQVNHADLDEYLSYLELQGVAASSLKRYRISLEKFIRWARGEEEEGKKEKREKKDPTEALSRTTKVLPLALAPNWSQYVRLRYLVAVPVIFVIGVFLGSYGYQALLGDRVEVLLGLRKLGTATAEVAQRVAAMPGQAGEVLAERVGVGYLEINTDLQMHEDLTVEGEATFESQVKALGGIATEGANIDAGTGTVTASNLVYGVNAGENIQITGNRQTPTISAVLPAAVDSLQGLQGDLTLSAGADIDIDGLSIANTSTLASVRARGGCVGCLTNAELSNSSVTVTAGTGLAGGGLVSLGGSVTLSSILGTSIDISDETNLAVTAPITLTDDTLGFSGSLSDLSDVNVASASDAQVLLYDGVTDNRFENVSLSGDITINNLGAATIQADSVALTADTTGSYVASITAGAGLTGSASSEGATPTLAVGAGNGITVNADDITIDGTTTGTTATTSANSGLEVTAGGLRLLGGCSDDQILQWNATTSTWGCGTDTGDIAAVGDVSSGAAFTSTSTQGTSLWFYDADGRGQLTIADLSAARTYTLPNASGEISLLGQTIANSELVNSSVTVTAGSALSGGGSVALGGSVTLNHDDTSSQASVDNSNGTVIQDITLDTYGHLTALTSYDLDNRYVELTGDTMTGALVLDDTTLQIQEGVDTLTLSVPALTTDRAVTLPDAAGEISLLGQTISNAELVNSSLTVTAGAGLTDGGSVALGASTTLNIGAGTGITVNANDVAATLGTNIVTGEIVDDTILEVDLDATNAASDGQILTYDNATGGFTWVATGSVGLWDRAGTVLSPTNAGDTLAMSPTAGSDGVSITAASGGTTAIHGIDLGFTQSDDADATDTNAALDIAVTSSSTDADTLYGINLAAITAGTANEYAIGIGSGWDQALNVNSTLISLAELQALDAGIALTSETTGDYVASFTAGGGLTGDASGEGATPTLAVGAGTGITVNANDIEATLGTSIASSEIDADTIDFVDIADSATLDATWVLGSAGSVAPTADYNFVLDGTGTGADYDSPYAIFRGNDGVADTELDMAVKLDVTSTTDYKLGFYDDGQTNEIASLDESGNLALDSSIGILESTGATYYTYFQGGDQSADVTYTLPIAAPSSNDYALVSSTGGTLEWKEIAGVGGVGDISAVGDITSGAAFTATAGNDGTTLYFEGSTPDGNEIALTSADPGSDLTVTLPGITGTLASLAGTQTFSGAKTFETDLDLTFAGTENLAITSDLAGTVDVISIIGTPSSTAGTAYGLVIDQADSANAQGLDSSLVIDNSDANLAIASAIKIIDAGGGFTSVIDNAGTLISSAELNYLDAGIALTTETTGNYVASITNGTGISGGDGGSEGAALTLSATLGTDIVTGEIVDDTILEVDLDATNAALDGQILTFDNATGGFTWVSSGDVGVNYWSQAGGILTPATAGDVVSVPYSDAADTLLTLENTTNSTIATADAANIDLTGGTTGIITNGVDALSVAAEFGNGTSNTNSLLHLNLDPVSTPSGDETFYAINIDGLAAGTSATETAIQIGANWDNILDINGTTLSATELGYLDGHDAALVDTDDAVSTAITGTGTLTGGATGAGFTVDLDNSTLTCTDCLDFSELVDSATLDATWVLGSAGSVAPTADYNFVLDGTGTGADYDSPYAIFRGNDGVADTELDMAVKLDVTSTTDYKLGFYDDGQTNEIASLDESGNLQIDGDLTISGDDLVMATNTTGYILVADNTNFNPVDVTGDIDIDSAGATTIQANAVALTTDTSGDYVASITNGTGISGGDGGSEGAALTLAVDQSTAFAWTGQQTWTKTITATGALVDVNVTLGDDLDVDTIAGVQIDATSAATGDADILIGLNIGNLTSADGTVTESAIRVGTSWDDILNYNGTTVINGSGQLVASQLTGTLLTAAGDSGGGQAIAQGDTLTIAGGTNITSVDSATDTVTLNLDDSVTLAGDLTVSGTGPHDIANTLNTDTLVVATLLNVDEDIDIDFDATDEELDLLSTLTNTTGSDYDLVNLAKTAVVNDGTTDTYAGAIVHATLTNTETSGVITDTTNLLELTATTNAGWTGYYILAENASGTDRFTVDASGNVVAAGDLTITGDDLFMNTNTTGYILVADNTNFNPVDVTGDIDIDSAGATTIQANAVALTTDTSGDYVASITNGTGISGGDGGSEGAALTLAVDQSTAFAWTGKHSFAPTTTGTYLDFILETEWTTGDLINMDFASLTTQSGDVIAMDLDFDTNFAGAADADFSGVRLQTPDLTSSGVTTTNLYGYRVSGAGALDTDADASATNVNWYGNYIQMPNIDTGNAADTTTSYGLYIAGGTVTDGAGTENQYGLIVDSNAGNVGIGTTGPNSLLHIQQSADSTDTTNAVALTLDSVAAAELTAASGTQVFAEIAPEINQSSTAGYTALKVNATETTTGSGSKLLADFQAGGTTQMSIDSSGNLKILGDFTLDDGGSIKEAGGTAAVTVDASGELTKLGQDTPSTNEVLTWDGSKAVWAAASGGGGGECSGTACVTQFDAEYPGAITSADGTNNTGTMSSGVENHATNYYYNYYEWTSGETTLQDEDIYITWKVPENWASWTAGTNTTITVDMASESTASTNNKVDVTILKQGAAGSEADTGNVSTVAGDWHTDAEGNTVIGFDEGTTCANCLGDLSFAAGDMMIIKITLYSKDNFYARVGQVTINWTSN